MRDRCASSPEAPESILCLIAWTIRLMLRSPLLSMTCIWSFSCSVASGDALHERGFRMLPKHELLLAICELLIFPTFFAYLSALLHSLCSGAKVCRIPIDGLGDLVRKIFPHQVVSAVAAASDPPSGFRGSWKYLCGAIFSARLNWRGSESRAAGNLLAHHSLYVGRMDALVSSFAVRRQDGSFW